MLRWGAVLCVVLTAVAAWGQGQTVAPQPGGRPRFDTGINAARDVAVTQKLDTVLPLEKTFRDENGKTVALKDYFHKKPVWMVLPFYQCTGTCPQMINGMIATMQEAGMPYQVRRDFEMVVLSINPRETPEIALAKKKQYLSELGVPGADEGMHFLTGSEENIRAVADALGYKYVYDAQRDQYAHASATFVLTPSGRVSRYHFGVVYPAKDVRLSLTEASEGKIGSVAEQILLFCYHYDPQRSRYGLAVFRLLQVLGTLTVVVLASFMIASFRKESREMKQVQLRDQGTKTPDREA